MLQKISVGKCRQGFFLLWRRKIAQRALRVLHLKMNTLLIIDTSSMHCAVALQRGDVLLERVSEAQRQSAQRVLPMISELLLEAKIQLGDIDIIAVVAGPGSFTGVRIGVAVAQGLSMSAAIPVVPLSSLALLAIATVSENSFDRVLVSEEAREGELYFAAYQFSDRQGVELVGREQVALIENLGALPEDSADASWCLAGSGWERQSEILQHLGCTAAAEPQIPVIGNQLIAKLALLRFNCGEAVDAAVLRPNYVKEHLDYT
jgi:tRNA threonylcarbamoyladenosine biosynthesis protein TsaB